MIDRLRSKLIEKIDSEYVKNKNYVGGFKSIAEKTQGALTPMLVGNILYGETTLTSLRDEELYWFVFALNETYKINIDINYYFLDSDIERAEDYREYESHKEKGNTLIIHNVIQVIENKEWIVPNKPIQEIDRYFSEGFVTYNPRTQRLLATKRYGKKVVKRIDINEESTREIADLMLEKEYSPTVMTLNILSSTSKNDEGDIIQNESFYFRPYPYKNEYGLIIGDLEIEIDVDIPNNKRTKQLNITDGYHRREGISIALRKNPDIDQLMHLKITRMTEREARHLIDVENKRNSFKEESISYYETTNVNNTIVDDLNSKGIKAENIMRDEIAHTREDALLFNKFTTYEILMTAIKELFNIKQNEIIKRNKISMFLTDYFNKLMFNIALNEDLNNLDENTIKLNRKVSYALEPNIFYGYVAMAKVLYNNKENWEEKLANSISKIDFKKENKTLKGLDLDSRKVGNKYRKNIYRKFEDFIK